MKPVLPGDVSAVARMLLTVPPHARPERADQLIDEARAADAHCRRTGRAHPRWGDGTLMAAAHGHPMGQEVCFDDPDYLDCQLAILHALRAFHQPETQDTQWRAVGPRSGHMTAMSSPHASR
ncbi:hypothetical protein SAMN04488078_11292 [Antarctobacter heliothermus]|uniref:DUF7742 domain-containing protein n=1 Tax=Antarctobacter heliothermus TaxID=74033 RepID=A0A239M7V9_9RHOB|nr:hypothetical protein SAMN04488078_11292 [Antarctobacter heliothermus]